MEIDIESITDNEDGSATIVFNIDHESLRIFAEIGILKTLTDVANRVLDVDQKEEV
jgi:hypothetical protein